MFGGICLVAVIVEFSYSIYKDIDFSLSASSQGFYLLFSSFYAAYQVYKSNKTTLDRTAESS